MMKKMIKIIKTFLDSHIIVKKHKTLPIHRVSILFNKKENKQKE